MLFEDIKVRTLSLQYISRISSLNSCSFCSSRVLYISLIDSSFSSGSLNYFSLFLANACLLLGILLMSIYYISFIAVQLLNAFLCLTKQFRFFHFKHNVDFHQMVGKVNYYDGQKHLRNCVLFFISRFQT